jgi:hypothetical protein
MQWRRISTSLTRPAERWTWSASDGDITYAHKVGSRFALLAASENYRLELPVHTQGEMKIMIPDPRAVCCFDIDHQGKGLRDLIQKGR